MRGQGSTKKKSRLSMPRAAKLISLCSATAFSVLFDREEIPEPPADQFLRKAPAVFDASGTPGAFIDLRGGGAISRIKSLSASVSNGLRSIFKFEGAAFAASL